MHKTDFIEIKPDGDHEQSWRAFKGKNLEKLIIHIIVDEVKALGSPRQKWKQLREDRKR